MGLISRVSSRTYRPNIKKKHKMAYHSDLTCDRQFGSANMAWMPLKNPTNIRGNAPILPDSEHDIIGFFRPNIFFAKYDVENNVDRTYVYGTLYAAKCLKKIARCRSKDEAHKAMFTLALQDVTREMPGDPTFPLKALYSNPTTTKDKSDLTTYLTQLRQEIGLRLVEVVFGEEEKPSKWWLMFNKYRFINKELGGTGVY